MLTFIDTFSVGLDEMPRRDQSDSLKVLAFMEKAGRFSCFEASANQTLAGTVTRLMRGPWVESYVPDAYKGKPEIGGTVGRDQDTYPWTYVRVTDAGYAALGQVR